MLHEYRDSPYTRGVCAGCGRVYGLCRGVKSLTREVAEILKTRPEEFLSVMGHPLPALFTPRFPVEFLSKPIPTSDVLRRTEELVARVALLRLEAGDDAARREFYASWAAYDEARLQRSMVSRDAQTRAEVMELERWLTLG